MITCYFEDSQKPVYLRHLVVDALVVDQGKILLVKRGPSYLEPNKWALPGGYLDRDETIRQAILRELKEETGYSGKIIKLFQIVDNPHRRHDDRQSVSFFFLVKPLKKISGFDKEIKAIRWFDLDNLPPPEDIAFDHLDIINQYLANIDK